MFAIAKQASKDCRQRIDRFLASLPSGTVPQWRCDVHKPLPRVIREFGLSVVRVIDITPQFFQILSESLLVGRFNEHRQRGKGGVVQQQAERAIA